MRRRLSACVVMSLLSTVVQGADWLKNLKVRYSLLDQNMVATPATVAFLKPRQGSSSYNVDAAIAYNFSRHVETLSLGPMLEIHKNTELEVSQDTLLAGVAGTWLAGDVTESPIAGFLDFDASYKRDRNAETKGTQLHATLTPLIKTKHVPLGGLAKGTTQFKWLLQPTVGADYDDVSEAAAGVPTGSRVRAIGEIEADFYPWATRLSKRLSLAVKYGVRLDISESSALNDQRDRHYLRTASLNYYFSPEKVGVAQIGLGLDRVDGENPSIGLSDQEYTQFSFKVRL
jgi:hypothetical protein